MMMRRSLIFVLVLLFFLVPMKSNAFSFDLFGKLAAGDNSNHQSRLEQISPSPSPDSGDDSNHLSSGNGPAKPPTGERIDIFTSDRCDAMSNSCKDHNNMTACIHGTGSQESFLLVQSDGENALKVRVKFLPSNTTFEHIDVPNHRTKKINISSNIKGTSSIVLNAGNVGCTIRIRVHIPQFSYKQFPYSTYMTPINGAYLFFLTIMIIGGTCACCRLKTKERHLDGVPYKELEMGQGQSQGQAIRLDMNDDESVEGWDQSWDDVWDEEKAVKPNDENGNGQITRHANSDRWGNDWDE